MTAKSGNKRKDSAESSDDKKKKHSDASSTASGSATQDVDDTEALDTLIELLDVEDVEDIDMETASELISHWQELLQQSDEPETQALGKMLSQLKKQLTSKKPKADEIAELMEQAGEQVDEFANSAKRGYKTKLHNVGKALKKIGAEIGDEE